MHQKLIQIHLLQAMNTYLKNSLAALHSLYLHLANIPAEKYHNKVKSSQVNSKSEVKSSLKSKSQEKVISGREQDSCQVSGEHENHLKQVPRQVRTVSQHVSS